MRVLRNILYVLTPNCYLSLDGENVVLKKSGTESARIPLHNLEGIIIFGYVGASPALMGACAERKIALTFLTMNGRFLARVVGENQGNVILRKTQYRISDSPYSSLDISKNILIGKIYNSRSVVERVKRDYALRVNLTKFNEVSQSLAKSIKQIECVKSAEEIRGIEGEAASEYFSVFDEMILQQKEDFFFHSRNRRPPLDNVNAMLSFVYTLLSHDTAAALSSVGLDPYVGFLHCDRPGRQSLALDLMEELRAILADRFVLTLINTRKINSSGFYQKENGAVIMEDDTRKIILNAWQQKKQETITHPYLKEKIEWGLVPYVQAMLLARCLRGDLDAYPPFLWK